MGAVECGARRGRACLSQCHSRPTLESRATNRFVSSNRVIRSMELRELAAFREVARRSSFGRAASALGYVQSTVSAQIQSLERDLGVQLFDRLGRRVVLTAAGRALLPHAERMLDSAAAARADVTAAVAASGEIIGTLTVSAPESLLTYRLPSILRWLRAQHPDAQGQHRPRALRARPRDGRPALPHR